MILEYLEKMREKPHAIRRRFAFMCALGVTLAIALMWGVSLPSQLASLSLSNVDLPKDTGLGSSISERNAELQGSLGNSEEMQEALSVFGEGGTYEGGMPNMPAPQEPVPVVPDEPERVILETTTSPKVLIATTSAGRRD